jgi:UDP-N-acetylmuramoyl-tripeptide--D-alanyl-D-alanine ligase
MRAWTPEQVAAAAGARLIAPARAAAGPDRVTIDSRSAGPGTLFVGLPGANAHGGGFAPEALAAGAWGVLTTPEHAESAWSAPEYAHAPGSTPPGVLLASSDPLSALQRLATAWRRDLNAQVIGVTGSTGKTSTKDLLLALLGPHRRTVASRANFNTEIGLPLEILSAPAETQILILEMGMRGAGQIDELARIAEPDVGLIVSVGPVHLELMGTLEAIAAAKAELIAALAPGSTAVIPANEPLLDRHRRPDLTTVTFGDDGDVRVIDARAGHMSIDSRGERLELEVPFTQAHLRANLLAAVAAARAVGVTPSGRVELALSPGRGQRRELPDGITLIDDCYNANPMSMRAALEDLAATAATAATPATAATAATAATPATPATPATAATAAAANPASRRVAVLGDMLELGPDERAYHTEIGKYANQLGVDLLVTVGPLATAIAHGFEGEAHTAADASEAAALLPGLIRPGDTILVKGSRGVGLELVCQSLGAGAMA